MNDPYMNIVVAINAVTLWFVLRYNMTNNDYKLCKYYDNYYKTDNLCDYKPIVGNITNVEYQSETFAIHDFENNGNQTNSSHNVTLTIAYFHLLGSNESLYSTNYTFYSNNLTFLTGILSNDTFKDYQKVPMFFNTKDLEMISFYKPNISLYKQIHQLTKYDGMFCLFVFIITIIPTIIPIIINKFKKKSQSSHSNLYDDLTYNSDDDPDYDPNNDSSDSDTEFDYDLSNSSSGTSSSHNRSSLGVSSYESTDDDAPKYDPYGNLYTW